MIGTRLAHYDIVEHLGSGGMGDVYAARDTKLGRSVALKLLPETVANDADRIMRFQREARVLASLNHPNIAAIHGIEDAEGRRFLVMELVEGMTLAERIARGPLPVGEALAIARQIVDGLDVAHERGIVHRDLKPANIKITSDNVVKLLDFGLATDPTSAAAVDLSRVPTITSAGTRAGIILGTASYMSPEQARGLAVDKRTDIWSFGCVVYEMLTARRAFPGATFSDIVAAILGGEPEWQRLPVATPPAVRQLLSRLLEKDPKRRVRDIADTRWELQPDSTVSAEIATSRPTRTKRLFFAGLVAAAVVIVAVTTGVSWLSRVETPGALPIGQTIVAQLTNYGGTESFGALSPDGRSFVFVSTHGGTPDLWLRQTSGGEPVRLTNDAAIESFPVYAPNSETIYFTRNEGADTSIWQIGALGGNVRKVVSSAQVPSPSRDGRHLAWLAPEDSTMRFSMVVGRADGGDPRVLVTNLSFQTMNRPSWSPDGRQLAYSAGRFFETRNLFMAGVADGQVRQVTRFERSTEGTLAQDWLPDNRHLVVSYYSSPRSQLANDVGVLDIDTGKITRLTMNVSGTFDEPSVSADGRRLIVTARNVQREVWRVPFGPDPEENGRNAVRLLDSSQDPMWTYVTRDGQTLLFNNALAGSRNLWLLPLNRDAALRQLTAIPGDAVMHSALSPDLTRVAFVSSTSGNADIWVQNVDGSGLRQLTNDAAADAWPAWSPDGRSIMFASQQAGARETRVVSATGGAAEKFADGFFRGDWTTHPNGRGTLMVTSDGAFGIRLFDVDGRRVIWEDRLNTSSGLPMFSADGGSISVASREIVVYDTTTGTRRLAARFQAPFQILFRASWVDNDRAFVVNRMQSTSHIVLFDGFWNEISTGRR